MRVLSIDTPGRWNAVGLIDGDQALGDLVWEARDNSLRDVILNIDLVLESAGLALADVDGLGVGIGPGSWTGERYEPASRFPPDSRVISGQAARCRCN